MENEVRNNEANSRPTDKVEAFKFEKKVYSEQYEFNQKVTEQLKAAFYTNDPYSRERHLNEGIVLINTRNKKTNVGRSLRLGYSRSVSNQSPGLRSEDERRIKRAVKEAKSLQDEKIKNTRDLRNLKEIFEIAVRSYQSTEFPTTQQDITSRLPVSNATDLAIGPETVKHQFHHLPLQGS